MAIFPDFPGLTLNIQIGYRKLPEYRDDDIEDPPRTVSYMIEAVPDTIFSIHAEATPEAIFTGSSLALQFHVDGKYVDGALLDATSIRHGSGGHAQSRGRYVRDDMLRRYQFASRERQIELVEKVSTSLSSRPRSSKRSTATPEVSYSGYHSAGINSAAPMNLGPALSMYSLEGEEYQSTTSGAPTDFYCRLDRENRRPARMPSALTQRDFTPLLPEAYRSVARPFPGVYHGPNFYPPNDQSTANGPDLPIRTVVGCSPPKAPSMNQDLSMISSPSNMPEPGYSSMKEQKSSSGAGQLYGAQSSSLPVSSELAPRTPNAGTGPTKDVYASRPVSRIDPRPDTRRAPATSMAQEASNATTTPSTTKDLSSAIAGSEFTDPKELGTIKIVVSHVNKKGTVAFGRNASTTKQIGDAVQEAVKEKSGGLLVRFTAPQAVSPITTWHVGAVSDDEGDTSMTFLYHYRTREMLDALGVLPKDEDRVRLPVSSGPGAATNGGMSMADIGVSTRSKRMMSQINGSRARDVAPEGGQSEEEIASNEAALSKTEADDDWEMVEEDRSGA